MYKNLKSQQHWTTREIILFARQYGYTPTLKQANTKKSTNLTDLIQKEIKREIIEQHSLTNSKRIYNYIDECNLSIKQTLKTDSNEFDVVAIDVVNDYDGLDSIIKRVVKTEKLDQNDKIKLSIPMELDKEHRLVSNLCETIQVKLEPEEIVPGN